MSDFEQIDTTESQRFNRKRTFSSLERKRINNDEVEFVDSIPDDAIVVNEYGTHHFEDYYYHANTFYFYNGIQYRKLHINELKCNGAKYVYVINTD